MAVVAALIFRFLRNRPASKLLLAQAASGIVAEAIMVAGFFSYSCLWLGKGLAAAASIPVSYTHLGDLDDQGHDGAQGGKEGSQHQLADFNVRHAFSLLSFCLVF